MWGQFVPDNDELIAPAIKLYRLNNSTITDEVRTKTKMVWDNANILCADLLYIIQDEEKELTNELGPNGIEYIASRNGKLIFIESECKLIEFSTISEYNSKLDLETIKVQNPNLVIHIMIIGNTTYIVHSTYVNIIDHLRWVILHYKDLSFGTEPGYIMCIDRLDNTIVWSGVIKDGPIYAFGVNEYQWIDLDNNIIKLGSSTRGISKPKSEVQAIEATFSDIVVMEGLKI